VSKKYVYTYLRTYKKSVYKDRCCRSLEKPPYAMDAPACVNLYVLALFLGRKHGPCQLPANVSKNNNPSCR